MKNRTVALVYLNSRIPKYVAKNMQYLSDQFPTENFVLISDILSNEYHAKNIGFEFFQVDESSQLWPEISKITSLPIDFRSAFWLTSLIRFKALENYLNAYPQNELIHIEADVLLLPNFPFDAIQKYKGEISFPMVSSHLAAASILRIKSLDSMQFLNALIEKEVFARPNHTDMTVLAKLTETHSGFISTFPTQPESHKQDLVDQGPKNFQLCEGQKHFNGIFDAATWGMYLLGTDPRNSRGISFLGKDFALHDVKASRYKFEISQSGLLSIREGNGGKNDLFCLHVHSKIENIFSKTRYARVVRMYVIFIRLGFNWSFSPFAFLNLMQMRIRNQLGKWR
jgi:hypothetical protein